MIDLSKAPVSPRAEQVYGVERICADVEPELGRIYPGCFAIFDEPGYGKTKQVLDAAQVFRYRNHVDKVIVICPNKVRPHWYDPDPEFGEIAKHLWDGASATVIEYRGDKSRLWKRGPDPKLLTFVVCNYEFLRTGDNAEELMRFFSGPRTLLVIDESSHVGNARAKQTKTCIKIRAKCGRVIIMNGTPETSAQGAPDQDDVEEGGEISRGSVGNIFSQAFILHPGILGITTWTKYVARYGIKGGWREKQIVAWRGVEEIQRKLAPYCIRRLKTGLPPRLPPVTLSVPMTNEAWKLYKEMRDDAVAFLSAQTMSMSAQAGVRVMRLAQVTSGYIGGVKQEVLCPKCEAQDPECENCGGAGIYYKDAPDQDVSSEKIDLCLQTAAEILLDKPKAKIVFWSRFRRELFRLSEELPKRFPNVTHGVLVGGQKPEDRMTSLRLLKPATCPDGPVIVTVTPGAGSEGLDFAAGSHELWVSHGTSLRERLQGNERMMRHGQVNNVWSADILATGPRGQHTIDHTLLRALRRKQNAAEWTCSAWVTALKEEAEQ